MTATASHSESHTPDSYRLDHAVGEGIFQKILAVTLASAVATIIGAFIADAKTFWFSYLLGFMFALSMSLGSLFWTMIHHVTSAGWSVVLRRHFENVTRAIPVLAILFLPLALFGLDTVYKWNHAPAGDLKLGKDVWFSKPFFFIRIAVYFAVWIGYSYKMRGWSLQMEKETSFEKRKEILRLGYWWGPSGILLLGLTATFAAFDLIMSLNYTWFSTIFGVYFWAGGIRSSMALCVLTMVIMRAAGYLRHTVTTEHLHDCGKLMFGFTVFWTYIAFDQYFLYWYGNVPEEVKFYNDRRVGTWYHMSVLLPICYFVVPFITLMPRANKRNPKIIGFAAAWIFVFHLYDLYWQIMPEALKVTAHDVPSGGINFHWVNLTAVIAFVGTVLCSMLYGMRNHPLVPIGDPRLAESIHHEVDEFDDVNGIGPKG